MSDYPKWADKKTSVESLAKKAMRNQQFLIDLIDGCESDITPVKYKSAKVLKFLSEKDPDILYPHWDRFVKRLSSNNTFLRSDAAMVLANLVEVDSEKRFDKIFDKCYRQLDDESMIPAANLVGNSWKIAKAQPHLQTKIVNRLMTIDATNHTDECKNIIKGKAIDSFSKFYDSASSANKKKIVNFVKNETNNSRSATKNKAIRFLKKWDV
jgi:uncharacterized protein YajQ (UPF0234 family)